MPHLHPDPDRAASPWASVDAATFSDWGWQMRHRIERPEQLDGWLTLSDGERRGFAATRSLFRFGVTPYYILLADRMDAACPIRRQVLPRPAESTLSPEDRRDPLGEEVREVAPNLIHRYPDRVLLLATDRCPVYCRFCTRRRIVGRIERQAPRAVLAEAFAYIRSCSDIREVIISGGDALTLGDKQLDYILTEVRRAPHVDVVRVASRMPVTCPTRVTPGLVEVLVRHGPVFFLTHFNHPRECTPSAHEAVARLVEAGIPVWNQSVLLRGINDRAETIAELSRLLIWMRVVPYYLHQCDLAEGIEHFRTPLQSGIDILDELRGHVSGLMMPRFCVDVPGGLGKVTVQPDWLISQDGRKHAFRTYRGNIGEYWDPDPGRASALD